ncbi:peptidoglycan recognition protein family protein [Aureimonas pseudogalii]|uniref:N-acetylmuramoyl-L-alanine amidase n=1 Tax=Aureimonas pseudogalii TaxID=1744844 RepID=A0A7W6MKY0_9HYPH|nr:N-acetylmuramoyl-L-alanine amidase [Aureimonas pseudogalii]MBB3999343.1 N-acetylmuramoyl-L-alanine amidase [Aureimonas pseudogalii]
MTPNTRLVDRILASPNQGERVGVERPDMLVLHYTGMVSAAAALERLTDPAAEVSAHYVVDEDGSVVQLVPEARRAWHAGVSNWAGHGDVNSRSIGIEIVNPGHEHGYRPFPPEQIASVVRLCRDCVDRWQIPAANIVAHSDIAPARKEDPGELFPWDQLFRAGVGRWVPPSNLRSGRFLSQGDRGEPVAAYQSMLGMVGYTIDVDGLFTAHTRLATIAFQRRFRPSRIDGVADAATVATLHALLKSF